MFLAFLVVFMRFSASHLVRQDCCQGSEDPVYDSFSLLFFEPLHEY